MLLIFQLRICTVYINTVPLFSLFKSIYHMHELFYRTPAIILQNTQLYQKHFVVKSNDF